MRLLLDEHFSPRIARALRDRGHDALAVAEVPLLAGASDGELLFGYCSSERRALVTNDVDDFARLLARGDPHHGIVFTDDRSHPRTRAAIGRTVRALAKLLDANPAEDAFANRVSWLA